MASVIPASVCRRSSNSPCEYVFVSPVERTVVRVMSSLETIIVGLAGFVLGAILTGLSDFILARRREARTARAVEIEIDAQLRVAEERLSVQLGEDVHWWWEDASAPSLEAW